MTYKVFERLTLAVTGIAIAGTILVSLIGDPIIEEIVAQILLFVVIIGAIHFGRNGGFIAAALATLAYVLMRVPLLTGAETATPAFQMIAVRAASFGLIGVVGGELVSRVKYVLSELGHGDSLDHMTRVYNERFIACQLKKGIGEFDRYGTEISVLQVSLEPALFLPLRKSAQRNILRKVATHLRNDVRLVDDVGRLEDGRFLVVLPNTPRVGADIAGERVRLALRDLLGAKDESVAVKAFGTPDDVCDLRALLGSLRTVKPSPVCPEPERAADPGAEPKAKPSQSDS